MVLTKGAAPKASDDIMEKENLFKIAPLDINYLENNLDIIAREFLNLFEYREFSDDQLRLNHLNKLKTLIANDNNFSISLIKDDFLKGYMLIEYMPYDSEIFGFSVYRISDFCFFGKDYFENEYIIQSLLDELGNRINALNIKYLTISINANIPISNLFFNSLMKNNFYYIHTLITFKMAKEEFSHAELCKQKIKNVRIRLARKEDRDALAEIARKSYKINRFHLDRNLNKEKCDLLHAKSIENSLLHGFADVIFVAEYKNEVVGYYSGKKNFNPILQVTLGNAISSAVSEKTRGLGIFSLMNNSLLEWFYHNTDIAEMGTYITNIPVHKTWTSNALSIIRGSYQLAKYY